MKLDAKGAAIGVVLLALFVLVASAALTIEVNVELGPPTAAS